MEISQRDLDIEAAHYRVIQSLATNNDFNAVKYLYDRLNIIDAKVSSLLRINAILFSAISLFVSQFLVKEAAAGGAAQPTFGLFNEGLLVAGYVALIWSTVLGFMNFQLRFDHVTDVPDRVRRRFVGACSQAECKADGVCKKKADCELHALTQQLEVLPDGTIESYEKRFFKITIHRQQRLRSSYRLTILGGVAFVTLSTHLLVPRLTNLGAWLAHIPTWTPS